jgi:type II secretory pathway component GspD/PulD (secretin)
MDFRNQSIPDILMVLADIGKKSIIVDESVTGNATFYFGESTFEEALYRFTAACNLYVEERDNAYYISKIKITQANETISVEAEDVNLETLVRVVSRNIGKTILYDPLPRAAITLHSLNVTVGDLLDTVIKRYPEFSVVEENNAFYLKQAAQSGRETTLRLSGSSITMREALLSMNIQRASFSAILALLFRTAKKEYVLLHRSDTILENLYYTDKEFDDLLRLVLEQANCDFSESGGIYYIFEIQRKDILKNYKDIVVVQMRHIPVDDVMALLPNDYSGASFIKTNKNTNSLYITGSSEEIQPIVDFLSLLDVPVEDKVFHRFEIHYLKVRDFISLLPKELMVANPIVIPDTNAFVAQVSNETKKEFESYIGLTDHMSSGIPLRLKYIKSEELTQNLPPSVAKEEIITTLDPTLIFYTGTREKQNQFLDHLLLLDQPKPQIRYQLLVMQFQRSDNINWDKSLSITDEVNDTVPHFISGAFSNLLGINFDVVSELGHQLAGQISLQIGEDKAKVLADTTLNGISGQEINFENTNTFRYRDATIDPETGKPFYTGVTREITSGIILKINGWVSGDGMITMQVNANVSKQDESGTNVNVNTNPPPTSTKVVNTQVRAKSGTPIAIGGLLQTEKISSIKKPPFLGGIPLLGRLFQQIDFSEVTTEMVIYIIPYVHREESGEINYAKLIERYFKKYIIREE